MWLRIPLIHERQYLIFGKLILNNFCNVFQEVSDKGNKIAQLESEKSALIRDLFNNKASSGKNGVTTKKSNKIF